MTKKGRDTVGFIGIGNMGGPMASNISKAGFDLTIFDMDRERAQQFAKTHGVKSARTLAELAANDFIVTMLPNGKIVREVLMEAEGGALIAALKPGSHIVDMSSAEPEGTRELAGILQARGIDLVDAPVSGGVGRAADGTLTIMVSADSEAAIDQVTPLLIAMGKQIFRVGRSGCGHAMKALNNFVSTAGFVATSEALLIGERFGLNRGTMVDVMNVSTGRSFSTDVLMKDHVVGEKFGSGFALGLAAKDVKIAADLAKTVKRQSPVLDLVVEECMSARDSLGATRDFTELYIAWSRK
ncbi:NAD(P)-dependent oxidoreductase [Variovorax paradoxus]|nr:NAD(P)-dependent oxidoreductase [Variovorax paradoxus]MBT2304841.1 NAD(P)-dependent oxidoreductase [Variovorax paradoxus]